MAPREHGCRSGRVWPLPSLGGGGAGAERASPGGPGHGRGRGDAVQPLRREDGTRYGLTGRRPLVVDGGCGSGAQRAAVDHPRILATADRFR